MDSFYDCRHDNVNDNVIHDLAAEKNMREHLQKERDSLLKIKYTMSQQLEVIIIVYISVIKRLVFLL